MDVLGARLAQLGCPVFLRPASSYVLSALELRRPLLLWLHAVYSDPSVRLAEDEKWARVDPSDDDLARWLRSLGVAGGAELLSPQIDQEKALEQLLAAVDGVQGRILLEERGDPVCLAESMQLMGDIAAHQDSIFDSQCQIFPMSVQMQTAGAVDVAQRSRQLAEYIQSLERQGKALRNRITSARDRMNALRGDEETAKDLPDSTKLSHELVEYLNDSLALMERVNAMLNDDAACWTGQTQPNLVGLGEASRVSSERLNSLLSIFQNIETLTRLTRSRNSKEQVADVLAHCQDAVDAVAPELRTQLIALQSSLQLRSSMK